jgi:hypothetical protein
VKVLIKVNRKNKIFLAQFLGISTAFFLIILAFGTLDFIKSAFWGWLVFTSDVLFMTLQAKFLVNDPHSSEKNSKKMVLRFSLVTLCRISFTGVLFLCSFYVFEVDFLWFSVGMVVFLFGLAGSSINFSRNRGFSIVEKN